MLDRKTNYEIALTQYKLRYAWYNVSKISRQYCWHTRKKEDKWLT